MQKHRWASGAERGNWVTPPPTVEPLRVMKTSCDTVNDARKKETKLLSCVTSLKCGLCMWLLSIYGSNMRMWWWGGVYYCDRKCKNTHAQTWVRSAVTTPLIRERLASFIIQRYTLPLHPSPRLLRVLDSEWVIQTDERTQDGGRKRWVKIDLNTFPPQKNPASPHWLISDSEKEKWFLINEMPHLHLAGDMPTDPPPHPPPKWQDGKRKRRS